MHRTYTDAVAVQFRADSDYSAGRIDAHELGRRYAHADADRTDRGQAQTTAEATLRASLELRHWDWRHRRLTPEGRAALADAVRGYCEAHAELRGLSTPHLTVGGRRG